MSLIGVREISLSKLLFALSILESKVCIFYEIEDAVTLVGGTEN